MKDLNKEKWIDDTLESLDGIRRADAPPGLFEKAMQGLSRGKARVVSMTRAQLWSAAACGLLLVVANLFMCIQFARSNPRGQSQQESFVREYFVFSEPLQY